MFVLYTLTPLKMQLLYIMDPMCAWCYAFQPELDAFLSNHPTAKVNWIMGGLAPDNTQPMDKALQETIESYWHTIAQKTNVQFNHNFWRLNTPYRSTYPACRAVISAEKLKQGSAPKMVNAIQSKYYVEAKNPALKETLFDCAESIGLDRYDFIEIFQSPETEEQLHSHFSVVRHLGIQGFPALVLVDDKNIAYPLALGFCRAEQLEQNLKVAGSE